MRAPARMVLVSTGSAPNSPERVGAFRAEAAERIVEVIAGAQPRPANRDISHALVQMSFRARHTSLDGSPTSNAGLARVFQAVLAHQDLDPSDVAWVAQDPVAVHPDVLPTLLAHPGFGRDAAVALARYPLWHQHGAADLKEWWEENDEVRMLRDSGVAGRIVAELLALWQDDTPTRFVHAAHAVLDGPPSTLEVLLTLAADQRVRAGRHAAAVDASHLDGLVDRALVVARSDRSLWVA